MAVPYTLISQKAPAASGLGDQTLHYARAVDRRRVNEREIVRDLERISTLSGADIYAAIHGLEDMLIYYLSKGHSVHFNALGTFRVGVSSPGYTSPDRIRPANFRRPKILFAPGTQLKQMLNNLEYERL